MDIALDITHPSDVHLFRHAIAAWRTAGHRVRLFARDKDVVLALLEQHGLAHERIGGRARRGALGLARELIDRESALWRRLRAAPCDVVCGAGATFIVHAAWLLGIPAVVFTDTEVARIANRLTFPFARRILTPRSYQQALGARHQRFEGYKELAYLHPARFQPDPTALTEAGLRPGERFVLMRLVAWNSGHDLRAHGLTDVRAAVARLSSQARVVISAEGALPPELEAYRYAGPAHRLHDVLAQAALSFGESATLATESAMLGVPAVFVSTTRRGYTDELEQRYGLVFTHDDPQAGQAEGLARAEALLQDPDCARSFQARRQRMLAEQQDPSEVLQRVVLEVAGARR